MTKDMDFSALVRDYWKYSEEFLGVISGTRTDKGSAVRLFKAGYGRPGLTVAGIEDSLRWIREGSRGQVARIAAESMAQTLAGIGKPMSEAEVEAQIEEGIRNAQATHAHEQGWVRDYYNGPWTFEVTSGRMHVGDPCYHFEPRSEGFDPNQPELGTVLDVPNGKWVVVPDFMADRWFQVDGRTFYDGGRVERITATHDGVDPDSLGAAEEIGGLYVDAGLMLVGDKVAYDTDAATVGWHDWLDHEIEPGRSRLSQHPIYADPRGQMVCSSTGYGDGVYPLEVRRDDQGDIQQVMVTFIGTDWDDEDEDDE